MSAVPFVNCFRVPAGREDDFMEAFREVNAYMAAKPGYVSHVLHRSLADDAPFRFVNYVKWETVEQWREAHDGGFRRLVSGPAWSDFTSLHALYEVVHQGSSTSSP